MKRVLEIIGWGLYIFGEDSEKKDLASGLAISMGVFLIAVAGYFIYVLGGFARETTIFGTSVPSSAHAATLPMVGISPFVAYVAFGLMVALWPRKKV